MPFGKMASPSIGEPDTSSNRDQLHSVVGGNLPSSSITSSASSTSLSNPPRLSTTSSSQFTAASSQTHTSEYNPNDVAERTYNSDEWFAKFHDPTDFDFFHASNSLPSRADLDAAGELPVYDLEGRAHPFKSLYSGPRHQGQRQLIIFLRHFYCGVSLQSPSSDLLPHPLLTSHQACQAYLRALTTAFPPATTFPTPTSVTIISCGSATSLPFYRARITMPAHFSLYTDHSRLLYRALGMDTAGGMKFGSRPEYCGDESGLQTLTGTFRQIGKAGFKHGTHGGSFKQVGGEFLIEEGKVTWCHRMRNIRDHTEIKILKKALEAEEDGRVAMENVPEELEVGRESWERTASLSTTNSAWEIGQAAAIWKKGGQILGSGEVELSSDGQLIKGGSAALKIIYPADTAKPILVKEVLDSKYRNAHTSLESGVTEYIDWDDF